MAANMCTFAYCFSLILLIILPNTFARRSSLIELNEDNWKEMLEDEWMVEFYAPWCPACKSLQPIWKDFSSDSQDLDIKVGQVDVTTSPGLSGRFMVTALPTIFHVLNGEFRQYRGSRDKDAFIAFIEDKKWNSIETISAWKAPNSIQMSLVSYFFKLSQILRALHNKLMEDYGLPTWGSYIIFAVATIFLGAMLGLVMVFILDLVYPPKPTVTKSPTSKKKEKGDGPEGEKTSDTELIDEEDDDGAAELVKEDLLDENELENKNEKEKEKEKSGPEDNNASEPSPQNSPNVKKRKPRKAD